MCVEHYELKPCPFCGGKGEEVRVYLPDSIVGNTIATAFAIQCTKCNALGKHTKQIQIPMGITFEHADLGTKISICALLKRAITYWNLRLISK